MNTDIFDQLKDLHRQRETMIKAKNVLGNMAGSYVRGTLGYDPGQGDSRASSQTIPEQAKAIKEAQRLVKLIEGCDDFSELADVEISTYMVVSNLQNSRKPLEKEVKALARSMEKLVAELPVADWVKSRKGFGMLNLARIIAETGDLASYDGVAKVWKRLGLAVLDGNRQGAPGKNAEAADWIRHGFSARRRAVVKNLEASLMKVGEDNHWRWLYLKAKETHMVSGKSNSPAGKPGHSHNHAMRLMGKEALKELWCEWNEAEVNLPDFITVERKAA